MSRAAIAGAMAEHPGLGRLYEANVPGKMSEREFWSRFLRQKTRLQQLGPTAAKGAVAQDSEHIRSCTLSN